MLDVFGTEFLLGAYGVIDRPRLFLRDLYFPTEQTFDTEKIAFDQVDRALRLAPFVSPMIEGKAMRQQGYQTRDFTPAYVKPKHVVDATRPLKRMPGERLLGSMTPAERYARVITELMEEEDKEIGRREEWMAAQILLNGAVTVEGEDFPPMDVDFGRPSGQTLVLSGGATWGSEGVSPLADLRAWNNTVMLASGFNAKIVVMDPLAELLFLADPAVLEILNSRANTPNSNVSIWPQGWLDLVGKLVGAVGEEVKYLGSIGEFEIFTYNQIYKDAAGNVEYMIPPNTVILGSPAGAQGTMAYGAIRDAEAGFRPLPRFPMMWRKKDPSLTYLMTQSAPLPVLGWSQATMAVTVA